LKAYGCLIKALRHDERGGFLNASIPFFVTPAIFKPGSTAFKTSGFPIKNFGNDERGVTPECLYEGPTA